MPIGAPGSLRIAIGAPYDLGRPGGVNSHIRSQAAALRRLGHDVCVFGAASSPLAADEVAVGGCVPLVISGTETGLGLDPRSERRIARLMRTRRFDVVHLHEPLTPLTPWFALWHANAPIVATFHTYREQGHHLYARYRWLLAPMMRRVRARVAVSEAARRTVADRFPGEYEVVPNGIDVERFERRQPRPAEMPTGARYVVYVGRLEPRKGVGVLLDAMSLTQSAVRDARLIVVGDGPDRAALENQARCAQLAATFVGTVTNERLPGYYQAADVACSPALGGESFGIVLLEAMAAETPVVASAIDGYAEVMKGAGAGRLVPPGDAAALSDALIAILSDDDRRRTMRAAARAAVREYDWDVVARRLERIYGQVASATMASRP